jgi:hypothetical protein
MIGLAPAARRAARASSETMCSDDWSRIACVASVFGVLNDELPHTLGAGAIEVDRVTPLAGRAEKRVAELCDEVSHGPEVVVDDIKHHREADIVGGVDEVSRLVW